MYLDSFNGPVNDPWFRTDVKEELAGMTLYKRNHFTRALACAERTELCKHDTGRPHCIQLNSYGWPLLGTQNSRVNITQSLGLSQRQSAVAERLQDASSVGDFASTFRDLGTQR